MRSCVVVAYNNATSRGDVREKQKIMSERPNRTDHASCSSEDGLNVHVEVVEGHDMEDCAYGAWFNLRLHPRIRKRWWCGEVELQDSGGAWTYVDWRRHQSWRRYAPQIVPLLRSVWMTTPLLAMVFLVTVFAGLYYQLYQSKTPGSLVLVSSHYFLPYYYLVIPLSLLLVFRTHVSYLRWWEARERLGDQQNTLRNVARLVVAWIWPKNPTLAADIVRLLAFLPPSSGSWFRHELEPMMANRDLVSDDELRYIMGCDQPTVAVGAMISKLLSTAEVSTYERCLLEAELGLFMNTIGALNRLTTMPLYLSYTRNCVRNLLWFMLGLPFALFQNMGWMTLVAVMASTLLCASIENVTTQIENPLLVLPVLVITTNSRRHVEATLASRQALDKLEASKRL